MADRSVERPWSGRRLHFVGIGGAGMSGLALLAKSLGAEVDGCDLAASSYTQLLGEQGVAVELGHEPSHLADGVEVIVSTAIAADSTELEAAREHGLSVLHRSQLLAEAAALRRTIAVAGTHGKTTTAAMIAHCLERLGAEPSYAVGADLRDDSGGQRPNAVWGEGEWFVLEADESDRSFLRFSPEITVVTNMELDHHTTYGSQLEFEQAFAQFVGGVRDTGTLVITEQLAGHFDAGNTVTFGTESNTDLQATAIALDARGTTFEVGGQEVRVALHGRHNVLNALAALAACRAAGYELANAAKALADFRTVGRRFEFVGDRDGVDVYDDYAHHPTEVRATLEAARELAPKRLVAVFQPHLYSRTVNLADEFGPALALADEVFVLDVYPAREHQSDYPSVSGKLIADAVADAAPGRPVWWLPTAEEVSSVLSGKLEPGSLVVTLGAGDVDRLAFALLDGGNGGNGGNGAG